MAVCVPPLRVSQPHRLCQVVVCSLIVGSVAMLARHLAVASEADQGSADRRPLCLSQGDGGEVVGQDVSAGHLVSFGMHLVWQRSWQSTRGCVPLVQLAQRSGRSVCISYHSKHSRIV